MFFYPPRSDKRGIYNWCDPRVSQFDGTNIDYFKADPVRRLKISHGVSNTIDFKASCTICLLCKLHPSDVLCGMAFSYVEYGLFIRLCLK